MLYKEEDFHSKNGKIYTLRSPSPADAVDMLSYLKQSAAETEHGLSYPEELDLTVQEEESFIAGAAADPGRIMISAFDGEKLVGNASLSCVINRKKTAHRAEFGIAILKSHWGQGLGGKILSELIAAARQAGYEQLELEVVATNTAAISLYKKLGFKVYGQRPNSFKLKSGAYSDELLMALDLK